MTISTALDFFFELNQLQAASAAELVPTATPKVARFVAFLASPLPSATPASLSDATPRLARTSPSGPGAPTATRTAILAKKPTLTPTHEPVTVIPRLRAAVITNTTAATSRPSATPSPTAVVVAAPLGETYGTLAVLSGPIDRPADKQADLNLSLRGFSPIKAQLGLVDYTGNTDGGAPQLAGLFSDNRTPTFVNTYQVYDWDWGCNCRGAVITDPEVTLVGLATVPGETIHLPGAGLEIGMGFQAFVLYADGDRIVFKYTRKDSVADGYTLHVEGLALDPSLLSLYQRLDQAGRGDLPALRAGQAFGRARGNQVRVAIRDTGTFMDPRSRKDWWRGR